MKKGKNILQTHSWKKDCTKVPSTIRTHPSSYYMKVRKLQMFSVPELLTISWCMPWLACSSQLWWCGASKPIFIIQYIVQLSCPLANPSFICFLPTCTAPWLRPQHKGNLMNMNADFFKWSRGRLDKHSYI